MKLIIALIIISLTGLVFLGACNDTFGKRGNGKVVTEQKTVSAFTKISIAGIFPVEISQNGGKEFVKVETDENLQDVIVVRNEGDKLVINTNADSHIRKSTKMKVYINIKTLRELEFKSVGSLTTANALKLDSLELNSESVGRLNLEIDAKFLRANLNAVGATILRGKAEEVRINNKSVGTLSAFDLKAGILMIHNTAIGSAEIYADNAFFIRSSSIGNLYYKGPGAVKELVSEGVGKVQKKD
jgi:hypothetical protein